MEGYQNPCDADGHSAARKQKRCVSQSNHRLHVIFLRATCNVDLTLNSQSRQLLLSFFKKKCVYIYATLLQMNVALACGRVTTLGYIHTNFH